MEPLGATASIVAVLELSGRIVKYVNAAAGSLESRRQVRHEVRACQSLLQQLKDEADDSEASRRWIETVKTLEAPNAPLGRLFLTLRIIEIKLAPRKGFKQTLDMLKWPFTETEIQKLLAAVEREKSLLLLALENDSRKLLVEIRSRSAENSRQLSELIALTGEIFEHNEAKLSHLTGLVEQLHGRQDDRDAAHDRDLVLDWLSSIDFAIQHDDIRTRRQPGTGKWFLDQPQFQNWMRGESPVLFCHGVPGAGKTFLASLAIDYVAERFCGNADVSMSYVYLNFRQQHEQTERAILSSILRQLVQRFAPGLPAVVKALYDHHHNQGTRLTFQEVVELLNKVISLFSDTFIVVDAIDEATMVCRDKLLVELLGLRLNLGVKILVTARLIPDIATSFEGMPSLEIRATRSDIEQFLHGHMTDLLPFVRTRGELQQQISRDIADAVDGIFLLAQLYHNSLCDKSTPKAIKKALAEFQKQTAEGESTEARKLSLLRFAYDEAMQRIQDSQLKDMGLKVLSWITCTERPLNQKELQHALAVEEGEPDIDLENITRVEDMITACAGLVSVDQKTGFVRLIHYTTQEYLKETQSHWFPEAELTILTSCVAYLSFEEFASGPCHVSKDRYLYTDRDKPEQRLRAYPFYDYAARHWGVHAMRGISQSGQPYLPLANFLAFDEGLQASLEPEGRHNKGITGLHLAAGLGLEKELVFLIDRGQSVDARDSYKQTPLHWAVREGRLSTASILLPQFSAAAKVDIMDLGLRTPLSWAAENGFRELVELLLARRSVAEIDDIFGRTPLAWATMNGHKDIRNILLAKHNDIQRVYHHGRSLLHFAAGAGDLYLVLHLLDKGANPNAMDDDRKTPVYAAALAGHVETVAVLLDHGAAINATLTHPDIQPPILELSRLGRAAVVEKLLDLGADANSVSKADPVGTTALSWSAARGHLATMTLLLDRGADMEAWDYRRWTALTWAAVNGQDGAVELLLSRGARAGHLDRKERTPLCWAAANGRASTVKILLEWDCSRVKFKDDKAWNALDLADSCAHPGGMAAANLLRPYVNSGP